jgi:anti-sigma regulatory factor (Ser/Thr protein kinase)
MAGTMGDRPVLGGILRRRTIRRVPDEVRLPPHPASVGRARRYVAEQLAAFGLPALGETAALVVSELVTNAVIHARTDITLRVLPVANGGRVEVGDGSTTMPGLRLAGAHSDAGRGLTLVEHFAREWGVERTDTGKIVWFVVRQED